MNLPLLPPRTGVMLCGHGSRNQRAVGEFAVLAARLREKLPTSGLVVIDFAFEGWDKLHPQSGRLERFVTPKSLAAAAR